MSRTLCKVTYMYVGCDFLVKVTNNSGIIAHSNDNRTCSMLFCIHTTVTSVVRQQSSLAELSSRSCFKTF